MSQFHISIAPVSFNFEKSENNEVVGRQLEFHIGISEILTK